MASRTVTLLLVETTRSQARGSAAPRMGVRRWIGVISVVVTACLLSGAIGHGEPTPAARPSGGTFAKN